MGFRWHSNQQEDKQREHFISVILFMSSHSSDVVKKHVADRVGSGGTGWLAGFESSL